MKSPELEHLKNKAVEALREIDREQLIKSTSYFGAMGYNLIWYIPLIVIFLFWIIIPNIEFGYGLMKQVINHWDWAYFISPSADLFFIAIFTLICTPILLFALIPNYFRERDQHKHPYLLVVLNVIGMLIFCFLITIIIWGSFPYGVDNQGYEHLRLIPFFPWPNRPFLSF